MQYIVPFLLVFLLMGCSNRPMDGASIYKDQCATCHGKMARKSALGKSSPIGSFSKEQIVYALKGYQNGTYGGSMKSKMKKQVSSLNQKEIELVAAYIADLY